MPHDKNQFQQLPFSKLFKRLDASESAATNTATVVTPSRRLARALKDSFNQYQTDQQKEVWHTADILPFTSFLERTYLEALYSSLEIPLLLTSTQAHLLWQEIIRSSEVGKGLLNITQTARLAYEAWQLLHAWQLSSEIKNAFPDKDCSVFLAWADSYKAFLAKNHQMDPACLADIIADLYDKTPIKKPGFLYCYGFEILTPQQITFLHRLQASGCEVISVQSPAISQGRSSEAACKPSRLGCVDRFEEIFRAALWARSRLEAHPTASIAVVVPALVKNRNAVRRIFGEVMQPDVHAALPQVQSSQQHRPFNISLGLPLSAYPLVDTALSVLELITQGLTYNHAGDLLRSPFLGGGESEMIQRALLVMRMRPNTPPFVTLAQLVTLVHQFNREGNHNNESREIRSPVLANNLSALLSCCQHDFPRHSHHAVYAQHFSHVLQIIGFPGERTLDSTEYQTLKKWHEVVADFAALDCVIATTHFADAVSRLKYMAASTLFQPETPRVPIQVLDVKEAAGMVFDHLWVMGLSDEQWPIQPRPNPFLPYGVQKNARIPMGSITEAFKHSRQLTDGWLSSANEVVLSYPRFGDGPDAQEIMPSPMIRAIPDGAFDLPQFKKHSDLIVEAACLERIMDNHVTPVTEQAVTGGVAVIKDYAACPFLAWARHRMKVKDKEEPHTGLNAAERGKLMHRALCLIWRQLKTKDALDTMPRVEVEEILTSAVDQAISEIKGSRSFALSERFAAIEHRRLKHLMLAWFDEEKKRDNFSVIATEESHTIQIGELKLQGRLDRLDRLQNGQLLIIDYKTRKFKIETMLGERPDEPQLPLYLVMIESIALNAAGIAFASIKKGQMGFSAILSEPNILPGERAFNQTKSCTHFQTWKELVATWKQDLTQLASGFLSGDSSVLPKHYPLTCQYCEMQSFCRIHERLRYVTEDQDIEND
ncbi:MAG: PD-(D/E)XK nuclease family protein [Burkholderiales bacterium]|nr:PD-(D/E)XK nuclease family protein [Nitrosomonas sp.]MCP5275332.1 PD-(D/E)XK nuclease family protein [Burkholderiales bacterium]